MNELEKRIEAIEKRKNMTVVKPPRIEKQQLKIHSKD